MSLPPKEEIQRLARTRYRSSQHASDVEFACEVAAGEHLTLITMGYTVDTLGVEPS